MSAFVIAAAPGLAGGLAVSAAFFGSSLNKIRPLAFDALCEFVRILDSTFIIQFHAVHIGHTEYGVQPLLAYSGLPQKLPVRLFLCVAGLFLGLFAFIGLEIVLESLILGLPLFGGCCAVLGGLLLGFQGFDLFELLAVPLFFYELPANGGG